ncbi:major facilitator superfamily domain-containing protein 6-like isoform X2 [Lycorma delicatula]|uniref:major facilitator superfamily domain-containing protein 6-like isoform X2 n=1 Tax=Lycorma delicatula TaxID=130591 RepID=UPI003F516FA7
MPLFSVRADLLPIKAHFFLFNAGTAPVVPFLPVYAKQLGFSPLLVGFIYTALPLMGMLAKPLMGAIADKFQCHKSLFISFLMLSIVSFFSMMYIPPTGSKEILMDIHCNLDSIVKVCSTNGDMCMADKIIAEQSTNSTTFCKLECIGDTEFLQSVCTSWGMPYYCAAQHREPLNHALEVAKLHLPNIGKTAHEKGVTEPPLPKTSAPQTLNLSVKLIPYHSIQMRNCLYVRFGGVKDLNYDSGWHVPTCKKLVEAPCKAVCESQVLTEIGENPNDEVPFAFYKFWSFVFLMIASWVGMSVVVSIGDTICFGLLGDSPHLYGYQRLWGSVGWGLFSFIAGFLVDEFSSNHVRKDYTPAFYVMAVLLTLDILVSVQIKDAQRIKSHNIVRDVGKLLMDARIVIFMLWCIVGGMCTAVIWNFLFWHLENLAKCGGQARIKTLEGLIMLIQCFGGELPFFFISGWLFKKIGHINSMSLVLFAFGIRFLLYSVLIEPWWCLPIELLNGLTFGTFYATMTSYASIVAPPGTEATIQGLVGAIFEGIGLSLGSLLAGSMFNYMEGATVFRLYGLVVLVICSLHIIAQFFLARNTVLNLTASGKVEGRQSF